MHHETSGMVCGLMGGEVGRQGLTPDERKHVAGKAAYLEAEERGSLRQVHKGEKGKRQSRRDWETVLFHASKFFLY